LPPFFFPPLAAFFAMFVVPPFTVVWCAGFHHIAMSLPPGTQTRRCGAIASWPALAPIVCDIRGVSRERAVAWKLDVLQNFVRPPKFELTKKKARPSGRTYRSYISVLCVPNK
jgi:hypothetical protein